MKLNILHQYHLSHSFLFHRKNQKFVLYVSGRLKDLFCRPSVYRQHWWPWQPPGLYVSNTRLEAASSGIRRSPDHAKLGKARHIIRYRRHGHQNRSIRPVTSGLWMLMFLSVLFLCRSATDTAQRHSDTNLVFANGCNLLASDSSQMFRSSSLG